MILDDTEIWSISRLGHVLFSRGRLDEAVALFHGLLHLDPRSAYAWYMVGLIRQERADVAGAAKALQNALSCDARHWPARVALAELLFRNGRRTDADAALRPLLDAPPGETNPDLAAALRRGRALWACWHHTPMSHA